MAECAYLATELVHKPSGSGRVSEPGILFPEMVMRGVDWFFRSRVDGRIVVGQFPNLPLWLFMAASGVAWIAGDGALGRWSHVAADVFLAWWAADELLRGVNPWRRCLGAGVLGWLGLVWISGARLAS